MLRPGPKRWGVTSLAFPAHVYARCAPWSCRRVLIDDHKGREATAAKTDSARAWLIVAAAFLASFVVFGVIYSFGVFLKPLAAEFGANAAASSAFFSITTAVFYASGALTGRLADRFEPRRIIAIGAVALGSGLCLTALVDRIWLISLIYGIRVGIGGACSYLPPLASIGAWFVLHRNTALGLAAAGTGCGTMALPPIAAALIQHYGWRTTNIIFGIAAGIVLLGCAAVTASPPIAPPAEKKGLSAGVVPSALRRSITPVKWALSGSGPPNWSSGTLGPGQSALGPHARFCIQPRRPTSPIMM